MVLEPKPLILVLQKEYGKMEVSGTSQKKSKYGDRKWVNGKRVK